MNCRAIIGCPYGTGKRRAKDLLLASGDLRASFVDVDAAGYKPALHGRDGWGAALLVKDFGKKLLHVLPGAFVRFFVVGRAF
jgi:hypothetical protein